MNFFFPKCVWFEKKFNWTDVGRTAIKYHGFFAVLFFELLRDSATRILATLSLPTFSRATLAALSTKHRIAVRKSLHFISLQEK
jgi:hypothetical protein